MRVLLAMVFGLAVGCEAATVFNVNITSPPAGNPGDVLNIFGSLDNNTSSTQYINSDSFTLAGFPGGSVDDSPFLTNAPLFLGPNASSGTFQFLTVTIPNNQAPGIYSGTFDVIGGQDGGNGTAMDNLGEGTFSVAVNGVPEPATVLLVAGGLLALVLLRRKAPERDQA